MYRLQILMCIVLALLLRTTLALPARGSLAPRAGQVDVPYIFVTFRAENEQSDGERTYLDIYTSKDGIQLEQYAMNVYQPQDGIVRDPSIIFYLGKYYIVHTTDWYSPYIAIISSDDLKSWQWVTSIKTGDWVSQAWAPEFFWDPKDGSLNIIVCLRKANDKPCTSPRPELCMIADNPEHFKAHIMTANAGETAMFWSAPKEIPLLTNKDSHIDMFVVYKQEEPDTPYHAFIKNEKSKVIEHWKAPNVGGDYEYLGVPGDDTWGDREGPTLAWIGTEWVMYADDYHGTVYYATSGDSYTWGDSNPLPAYAGDVRHGTLLHQN